MENNSPFNICEVKFKFNCSIMGFFLSNQNATLFLNWLLEVLGIIYSMLKSWYYSVWSESHLNSF